MRPLSFLLLLNRLQALRLLLGGVLWGCLLCQTGSATPTVLSSSEQRFEIEAFNVWAPELSGAGIEDALVAWKEGRFLPTRESVLHLEAHQDTWIYLEIAPLSPEELHLDLNVLAIPLSFLAHYQRPQASAPSLTPLLLHADQQSDHGFLLNEPQQHWLQLRSGTPQNIQVSIKSADQHLAEGWIKHFTVGVIIGALLLVSLSSTFHSYPGYGYNWSILSLFYFCIAVIIGMVLGYFQRWFGLGATDYELLTGLLIVVTSIAGVRIQAKYYEIEFPEQQIGNWGRPHASFVLTILIVFLVWGVLGTPRWIEFSLSVSIAAFMFNAYWGSRKDQLESRAFKISLVWASQVLGALSLLLIAWGLQRGAPWGNSQDYLEWGLLALSMALSLQVIVLRKTLLAGQTSLELQRLTSEMERQNTHLAYRQLIQAVETQLRAPLLEAYHLLNQTSSQELQLTSALERYSVEILNQGLQVLSTQLDTLRELTGREESLQVREAAFELRSMLYESQDLVESRITSGVRLELVLPQEPLGVRGDRWIIQLVVVTLLENAFEHAEASTVQVVVQKDGDHWKLEVRDNGKGLPPEVQGWVQDFRPEQASQAEPHLGLGMCLRMLAAHQQPLRYQNLSPGASFSFRLPDAVAVDPPPIESILPNLNPQDHEPAYRVLICSTDVWERKLLEWMMRPLNTELRVLNDPAAVSQELSQYEMRDGGPELLILGKGAEDASFLLKDWKARTPALVVVQAAPPDPLIFGHGKPYPELDALLSTTLPPQRNLHLLRELLQEAVQRQAMLPPKAEERHADLVKLQLEALRVWTQVLGKEKAALAQESGLWKVHYEPEQNRWRTRTFDRYLQHSSLPKHPRWKTVLGTAEFVREQAAPEDTAFLQQLIQRVQTQYAPAS